MGAGLTLMNFIVHMGDGSKVLKQARSYGILGGTVSIVKGAAGSPLLEFLGLDEVRREMVSLLAEDGLAGAAMTGIGKIMDMRKHDQGIAFSVPLGEFFGGTGKIQEKEFTGADEGQGTVNEEKTKMNHVIYVVVDKGKAEEVIASAQKAGAKGGTIMNARGAGVQVVRKYFDVDVEPEKEIVFILTPGESKDAIVESVRKDLRIDEPGKGVLFVLDVKETYGVAW